MNKDMQNHKSSTATISSCSLVIISPAKCGVAVVIVMTKQSKAQRAIGSRVRELRKRRGWSQEYLSDLCHIHRSHMGAIERGETNITLSTLIAIAGTLETRIAVLFAEAD
jgi:DNA-binding XRE family transcriptional regulator